MQQVSGHIGVPKGYDGMQEEYNEIIVYYKHPGLPEGVFMMESYRTDSYGNNENLHEIRFVKGKEKKVTVYEPI
jgi:hypothetical protein